MALGTSWSMSWIQSFRGAMCDFVKTFDSKDLIPDCYQYLIGSPSTPRLTPITLAKLSCLFDTSCKKLGHYNDVIHYQYGGNIIHITTSSMLLSPLNLLSISINQMVNILKCYCFICFSHISKWWNYVQYGSWKCSFPVTWFCYLLLIAKPVSKTASALPWPSPHIYVQPFGNDCLSPSGDSMK